MNRAKARKERKSNKLGVIAVSLLVILICGVMYTQITDLKTQEKNLIKKEQKLEKKYEEESKRSEALEEQRIYVQTKKYVEEVAKKLGYVYPDEIILKPEHS